MSEEHELTYYEYWLTKPYWNAAWAIQYIFDYCKFKRGWDKAENYADIRDSFKNKLAAQMNDDNAQLMFARCTWLDARFDDSVNEWKAGAVDPSESDVKPKEFIEWLHSKGYHIPHEFKVFIGIEPEVEKINQKVEQRIDKAVCQGIARTLWDIYPDMTIEEMQYHKAIDVYGGGKGYPGEGTVKGWLRDVDPREIKRGRKKKS